MITLDVKSDSSESMDTIKKKITIMEGICLTRQKLFFNEQQLDDEPSMVFYQIPDMPILVLQVQLIGHDQWNDRDFDSEMNSGTDGESTCAPESSSDEKASSSSESETGMSGRWAPIVMRLCCTLGETGDRTQCTGHRAQGHDDEQGLVCCALCSRVVDPW
jgi:hypothetical protein